jgi:hypothetical protein
MMTYAELTEAFLERGDVIERVKDLLDTWVGEGRPRSLAVEIRAALEATNTPHNDPEFGFDKTAALSDPGEDAPSQVTPMCRVHPDHFMPCSRCLGYGCTACDNAVNAADDRRAL